MADRRQLRCVTLIHSQDVVPRHLSLTLALGALASAPFARGALTVLIYSSTITARLLAEGFVRGPFEPSAPTGTMETPSEISARFLRKRRDVREAR